MMTSVFLSRIIGLVREQVIAHFGGTSTTIDAYVTAFFIPELLNHFLAGGFLSITFIPIFQRHLAQADEDGAWGAFSNIITVGSIAFAIIIPISIIFAPDMLRLLGPHIANAQTLPLTVRLTRIILPAQMFFYWGAFFSAVQMARHRFFLPAMAPLAYNGGIILGGLLLGRRFGIEGFAWGVLAGSFVANVLVQLPGAMKAGLRFHFRFNLSDPDLKKFIVLSVPVIFGLGMTFSNEIFFRFFGSFLGEGGTSSINYALRTMGFVVAIFGQASGVAFYPYLSKLAAERNYREITSLVNKILTRIAGYCIPLSLLMAVLAPQIISILYEHGHFTHASTARTAPAFALYMVGAFAFSAAVFVVRPFYAIQRPYIPMIVSSVITVITLPLYYFTSKAWGAPGIAASASMGMVLQFVTLYVIWYRRHADRHTLNPLLRTLGTIIGVSIIGATVAWGVRHELLHLHFSHRKLIANLIVSFLTTVASGGVVLALYEITGIQKIRDIMKHATRR
jgi:putative peptidoglycan lipid II flippase